VMALLCFWQRVTAGLSRYDCFRSSNYDFFVTSVICCPLCARILNTCKQGRIQMKKLISVSLVAFAALSAPAFADAPGASGVAGTYGEVHKGLATSGGSVAQIR
jgi:hypothetical protein